MDYIIGIDSTGMPYIEHARGQRNNHKYYVRISDGKGGFRYFYSQKEVDAYYNKKRKTAERAENGKNVNIKQYLSGGKEKKSFNYYKKENNAANRELKRASNNYTKSVNKVSKATAKFKKANESGNAEKIKKAETNLAKKKDKVKSASQRATYARINKKETGAKYEAHERAYESTSLPGQTHRLVRKGKEKIKRLSKKIGTTPVVYVKKSKD